VSAAAWRRGHRITRGNGLERPAGEDDGGEGEATVSRTCGTEMMMGPEVSEVEKEGNGRSRKVVARFGVLASDLGPRGIWRANGSSRDSHAHILFKFALFFRYSFKKISPPTKTLDALNVN
jgi:hypothetical protein